MQPPYGAIARLLSKGDIVPFLGAGASLAAAVHGERWDPGLSTPPSGLQLAEHLAEAAAFPGDEQRKELAKVASYYQTSVDREDLLATLREVFDREFTPGPIHQLLAQNPKPLLIVTTN